MVRTTYRPKQWFTDSLHAISFQNLRKVSEVCLSKIKLYRES